MATQWFFTCRQELWHYQFREMLLKQSGGYEKPKKTNATTWVPSAFVFHCFGRGYSSEDCLKDASIFPRVYLISLYRRKATNPLRSYTTYTSPDSILADKLLGTQIFSALSRSWNISCKARKPASACTSCHPSHSAAQQQELWSSRTAVRSLWMPEGNASATQKCIGPVRFLHLITPGMENATEKAKHKTYFRSGRWKYLC